MLALQIYTGRSSVQSVDHSRLLAARSSFEISNTLVSPTLTATVSSNSLSDSCSRATRSLLSNDRHNILVSNTNPLGHGVRHHNPHRCTRSGGRNRSAA